MDRLTPETCRAARAFLHWRQVDLGERAGVSEITIKTFERGVHRPKPSTLERIETALTEGGVVFCKVCGAPSKAVT